MGKVDETYIRFRTEDYQTLDDCRVIVTDFRVIDLLYSCLRFAEFYTTRWVDANDNPDYDNEQSFINGLVQEAKRDLVMSYCGADLTRIADSMESIDEKTPELIPLSAFATAISTYGGFEELEAFLNVMGLLPGIDLKFSPVDLIAFIFEVYNRKAMLLAEQTQAHAQVAIMRTLMADAVTDKANEWIDTLLDAFTIVDIVGDGWNAFIGNILKAIDIWGDGETPPEIEPRTMVNLLNEIFVEGDAITIQNFVDACCNGGVQEPPASYEDDGETPPDGFPDYPTYNQHKCNAGQMYVNSLLQDLSYLVAIGGGSVPALTAATLGAALFVPGVNVVVLIGLLIALVTAGTYTLVVDGVIDWVTANQSEIRCAIYNATDAAAAKSAVQTLVIESDLDGFESLLINYFITQDAFNVAFFEGNVPDLGADCTECDGCANVGMVLGSWDGENEFTSAAHPTLSDQFIQVQFEVIATGSTEYCNTCTLTGITILSGTPAGGGGSFAYRLQNSAGVNIYNANTLPTFPVSDVSMVVIVDRAAPSNQIVAQIDWSVD